MDLIAGNLKLYLRMAFYPSKADMIVYIIII